MGLKEPRSIQVVVFHEEQDGRREYLLLRRLADRGGIWQTVTGSLELGETHLQAAVREVGEETGWPVSESDLVDLHLTNVFEIAPQWRPRYAPGVVVNEEVCFCMRSPNRNVVLDEREHDACQWAPFEAATALVFYESSKRAVEATDRL